MNIIDPIEEIIEILDILLCNNICKKKLWIRPTSTYYYVGPALIFNLKINIIFGKYIIKIKYNAYTYTCVIHDSVNNSQHKPILKQKYYYNFIVYIKDLLNYKESFIKYTQQYTNISNQYSHNCESGF
jgi:hypothetical protein